MSSYHPRNLFLILGDDSEVALPAGAGFETAEMADELDQPVNEAEVWLGEKTPVVLLPTTMVMVIGPDCGDDAGTVSEPVLFSCVVPWLELPGAV